MVKQAQKILYSTDFYAVLGVDAMKTVYKSAPSAATSIRLKENCALPTIPQVIWFEQKVFENCQERKYIFTFSNLVLRCTILSNLSHCALERDILNLNKFCCVQFLFGRKFLFFALVFLAMVFQDSHSFSHLQTIQNLGWDLPSSTSTILSSCRVAHWKSSSQRLRQQSFSLGEFEP